MNQKPDTQAIIDSFVDAIAETAADAGDQGAPLGPMYAAFMTYGIDYSTFQGLIMHAVLRQRIVVRNNVAYKK